MPILQYKNYNINYDIIQNRPAQRNIILRVHAGQLYVSAPKQASLRTIQSFVESKAAWIVTKIEEQEVHAREQKYEPLASGTSVAFQGRPYQVEILQVATKLDTVRMETNKIIVTVSDIPEAVPQSHLDTRLNNIMYNWFFEQARKFIPGYVTELGNQYGLIPQRVVVKEQKSRWGSCSVNGSIYMNWRLIQAPVEVLQYVSVHELAHLREQNHSPRFWKSVESMLPEYKQYQTWLKHNGSHLFRIQAVKH